MGQGQSLKATAGAGGAGAGQSVALRSKPVQSLPAWLFFFF